MLTQDNINDIVTNSLNELNNIKRKSVKFPDLLGKCNPYELAVNVISVDELVDFIMSSHRQTSSKTIWGYFFELIALKVSETTLNGFKSKEECTDIEWVKDGKSYYMGWKSSPNWANADQKRMVRTKENYLKGLKNFGGFKILTTYGKTGKLENSRGFTQLSGKDAWKEISGDDEMYNKVMVSIINNSENIRQFIDNVYISDRNKSINWVTENFVNSNNELDLIKINNYVSNTDNITTTKW